MEQLTNDELEAQELQAKLFAQLSRVPLGTVIINCTYSWLIVTPLIKVEGSSLADVLTKATHRGLFE